MELEPSLYGIMEALAPQLLSQTPLRAFVSDVVNLLRSPTKSAAQLSPLIDFYKLQSLDSSDTTILWHKIEKFLDALFGIQNTDDMVKYLSVFQSLLPSNSRAKAGQVSDGLNMENLVNHEHLLSPVRAPSIYTEASFENMDRFSERRSMISSPNRYVPSSTYTSVTLRQLSNPYYVNTIPEEDILKYVSYTLLATTSELFPFNHEQIQISTKIPNFESGLLHLIFEAGLLCQNLGSKVETFRMSNISPMKKALLIEISEELQNYTAFVNNLVSSRTIVSLKSLYREIYENIIRLRIYCRFTEHFAELSGDTFLIELNIFKSHGDLAIRKIATNLFNSMVSLYYEYLMNWLTKGLLRATYGEFFITENAEISSNDNDLIYHIPIEFIQDRVPNFIPKKLAYKILMIGKSYIFLEKYCKEIQWTNEFSKKYHVLYQSNSYRGISTNFFEIVNDQYFEIVNYTKNVLDQKFQYIDVVFALKDILLMGKSDFVDVLIEKTSNVLATPSDSLPNYKLTKFLQEAVQLSSLRHLMNSSHNNYVINGLDARVLDLGHGSVGWDVFTLDYILHPPLSLLLNVNRPFGRKEYLRIFNFLWRFKKNNYFYQKEMLESNETIRSFKKIRGYNPLIRDITSKLSRISILRSQLQQFNSKMESYYLNCIIERNFKEMTGKLNCTGNKDQSQYDLITLKDGTMELNGILPPKPTLSMNSSNNKPQQYGAKKVLNIDELESLHNAFLTSILSHKLFATNVNEISVGDYSGQPYPTSLVLLLNYVYEFIKIYSRLNGVAYEIFIKMNLNDHEASNGLLGNLNTMLKEVVDQYKNFKDRLYIFRADLKNDGDEELFLLSKSLR
ncbi:spc98p [Saccharomyces arboricola H-6]|uniref:Spindle pole body component n=1 Tax=Saccharomyces arboricola (strain H-6 / AS 2.3317 / CBS 10644) TaxID=1160507 RepID=J8LIX3_SACAR|nr:spc98p [Saccharomyces arboricola H-6]